MVHGDTFRFVQRQESALQENLMLLLQWQGETVDDAAEDLEKLRDAVVSLSLIDKSEKDVVDCLSNERPVYHELPIDAVQDCFEIIPLAGIL